MEKVMIAMSGGVDSSVCAKIIKEKGYDIIGATMHLFDKTDKLFYPLQDGYNEAKDAKAVADALGVDFYVFDLKEEFKKHVIEPFIDSYENAGTPNPCLYCNKQLKFGVLIDKAIEMGCDFVATGHYAHIVYEDGRYKLKKATDLTKDQSYVLFSLTQDQLSHTLFPLGNLSKEQVKEIAKDCNFVTAGKKESQDICFVPDGDYVGFMCRYTGKNYPQGNFVDKDNNILGKHKGIVNYTIGQRKGLGISAKEPLYVLAVEPDENKVVLGSNDELFSTTLDAHDLNLIAIDKVTEPMRVKARVRYRHIEQWATVTQPDEDTLHVVFDEPQRAITKGQAVVLYQDDVVIGGGTIG